MRVFKNTWFNRFADKEDITDSELRDVEKKYYSEALMAVHQSAKDLFEIGAISEKEMKEYDENCFVKEPQKEYTTKPIVLEPAII